MAVYILLQTVMLPSLPSVGIWSRATSAWQTGSVQGSSFNLAYAEPVLKLGSLFTNFSILAVQCFLKVFFIFSITNKKDYQKHYYEDEQSYDNRIVHLIVKIISFAWSAFYCEIIELQAAEIRE